MSKILNARHTVCLFTLIGLSLSGCSNDNPYDNGYEAAWEGDEPKSSSILSNREYDEGYEQGADDAYMYDFMMQRMDVSPDISKTLSTWMDSRMENVNPDLPFQSDLAAPALLQIHL